jgi:hypothetical protein
MFPSTPIIGCQQVTVAKLAIMSRPGRYCYNNKPPGIISESIVLPSAIYSD